MSHLLPFGIRGLEEFHTHHRVVRKVFHRQKQANPPQQPTLHQGRWPQSNFDRGLDEPLPIQEDLQPIRLAENPSP